MMDFGLQPEPETNRRHKLKIKKSLILYIFGLLIIAALLEILFISKSYSPVPNSIKSQINYKTVYPTAKTGNLGQKGYQYQASQQTLTFSVNSNNNTLEFTEQPAPPNLGSGNQIYFPAIGLHPYAQFQSKLGPVALIKFYQTGSLKPEGQSAVLASNGTLVIAHSGKNLTNEEWKDLINSLKISK